MRAGRREGERDRSYQHQYHHPEIGRKGRKRSAEEESANLHR
jgi:hypothetical protein